MLSPRIEKAFVPTGRFRGELGDVYQVEAVIDGEVMRLQGQGPLPEECVYDRRHSGLRVIGVFEGNIPTYEIGCGCGYRIVMDDVNVRFERHKK